MKNHENIAPPKRKLSLLKNLFRYLLRYKIKLAMVLIIVIIANLTALLIPKITGSMVDSLGIVTGKIDYSLLIKNGLTMLVIAALAWGMSVVQNRLMLTTAQNMVVDLRHDVFEKLMKLPVSYFDTNTKGNIISIVSTDVDNISETVSSDLITLITGVVTVIGALVMMLSISPVMTTIFFITIPLMFIISRKISKQARALFSEKKANYGKLCGYAEEMITAQKTVKVYGLEDYNNKNFEDVSDKLRKSGTKAEFVSSKMMPSMNFINNLNFIGICAIGAVLAVQGKISIGDISSFVLYSKKFAGPIIDTANIINMLQVTLAACDRVFSILNADEEVDEIPASNEVEMLEKIYGDIELDHVNFSYRDGTPVLKNVNLKINAGQKVAIVGATGSGKTTIISLLLRFYDVTNGKITIDGVDIRAIPIKDLRQYYALVLQDSWLFEGTIMENLCYAAPDELKNPDKVKKICKEIEVDDFIMSLENGYETVLKSDSGGLSQGQKQMLNIVRAFLCHPQIFILDEATSSVDTLTEQKIKTVTDIVTKGRTSIIIAHRLTTILNADKIIMLKDGEICEVGTHKELIKKGGLYEELYQSQFASLNKIET